MEEHFLYCQDAGGFSDYGILSEQPCFALVRKAVVSHVDCPLQGENGFAECRAGAAVLGHHLALYLYAHGACGAGDHLLDGIDVVGVHVVSLFRGDLGQLGVGELLSYLFAVRLA